nr:MAG TPA: hypothetical protein [Caudoviricetes sp.]
MLFLFRVCRCLVCCCIWRIALCRCLGGWFRLVMLGLCGLPQHCWVCVVRCCCIGVLLRMLGSV